MDDDLLDGERVVLGRAWQHVDPPPKPASLRSALISLLVGAVTAGLLFHAWMTRYEWHFDGASVVRFDRWSGESELGAYGDGSRWWPMHRIREQREQALENKRAAEKEGRESLLPSAVLEALRACEEKAYQRQH